MENYGQLSIAFKGMLIRAKVMKNRQRNLKYMMDDFTNKSFIPSEQFWDMQSEYDGIESGLKYLGLEIKRAVITLKICLYKQRMRKNGFIKKVSATNFEINTEKREGLTSSNGTRRYARVQGHIIPFGCGPNNKSKGVQIHDPEDLTLTNTDTNPKSEWTLVNFGNTLILPIFRKFTGGGTITRVGVG